jgi:hypothetical protein
LGISTHHEPQPEPGREELAQPSFTSPVPSSSAIAASFDPSHATSTDARHAAAVKRVQQEWGFQETATAEKYLKSVRHRNHRRGHAAGALTCVQSNDPSTRLMAFREGQFALGARRRRRGPGTCAQRPNSLLTKHLEEQASLYCTSAADRGSAQAPSQTCSSAGISELKLPPPVGRGGQGLGSKPIPAGDSSLVTLINRVMHAESVGRVLHHSGDGETHAGCSGSYPIVGQRTPRKKGRM